MTKKVHNLFEEIEFISVNIRIVSVNNYLLIWKEINSFQFQLYCFYLKKGIIFLEFIKWPKRINSNMI